MLRSSAMLGPSHPDTKVRCTGDDDTPLFIYIYRHPSRSVVLPIPLFFDHPPFNSSLASHLQQPPNGIPIDLSLLSLKPSFNSTTPLSTLILQTAAAFPNEASTLCRSLGKHVAECLFKTRCAHASTFAHSAVAIAAVAVRRHGPRILQGAPANVPLKVTQLQDRRIL